MSGFNPYDGINDDMHTHIPLGAAGLTDSTAAPVGTRDTTTPRIPRELLSPVHGASVSCAPAAPAAYPNQDGASTPSAPSTPETWQQRALRMLLEDNASRCNTRFGMLTMAEVLAIESLI